MLGEDVAIDGGIRSKSFRGFNSICNSSWLSAFEPRIRYQLRVGVVAHPVVVETLC